MKTAQLVCSDAVAWLRSLDSQSVDLLATDPPYGHGRIDWDRDCPALAPEFWVQVLRVCKRDAAIVMFAQGMFTARLTTEIACWRYNLVWSKNKAGGFLNANRMPLRAHEDICVFYRALPTYRPQMTTGHAPQSAYRRKSQGASYGATKRGTSRAGTTDRHPTSVLHFPVVNNDSPARINPTQKPVELMRWIVRSYSDPGEVVADPFAGSASTGVAALLDGRRFIGCDNDGDMVAKASERLSAPHNDERSGKMKPCRE